MNALDNTTRKYFSIFAQNAVFASNGDISKGQLRSIDQNFGRNYGRAIVLDSISEDDADDRHLYLQSDPNIQTVEE